MDAQILLADKSLNSWRKVELPFTVLADGSVEIFFPMNGTVVEFRFIWADAYGSWLALDCTPQKTAVLFAGILASYPARNTTLTITLNPKEDIMIGQARITPKTAKPHHPGDVKSDRIKRITVRAPIGLLVSRVPHPSE